MLLIGAMLIMSPPSLLDFSIVQWHATPELRIEDAYKWLLHATLGGDHAVQSEAGPRRWLEGEWKTLTSPMKGEPLEVPLRPDGKLIRVNLRPYKSAGGKPEPLLQAFVQSAKQFRADKSQFVSVWDELGRRLQLAPIGHLTTSEWWRLDALTRPSNWPAIDHSKAYESAYHPAYRVMLKSVWHRS